MLSGTKVWNVELVKLCNIPYTALKSIIKYAPYLMKIGKLVPIVKFIKHWAYIIECMSNRINSIQHISGKLMQNVPCIMLQNVSDNNNLNRKALE